MKSFAIIMALMVGSSSMAQELPQWYKDLLKNKEGEWVADNSEFLSETDSSNYYSIHWWIGVNEKDLHGVLKNEEDQVVWSYYQYFNESEGKAILLQYGLNGVVASGELVMKGDTTELSLSFSGPNGNKWNELHHTIKKEDSLEETISYSFDKEGVRKKGRMYQWEKEEHIKL